MQCDIARKIEITRQVSGIIIFVYICCCSFLQAMLMAVRVDDDLQNIIVDVKIEEINLTNCASMRYYIYVNK